MKGTSNPANIASNVIVLVLTVFIVFKMIEAFTQSDPTFGKYGLPILAALVIGVIAYLKSGKLFG